MKHEWKEGRIRVTLECDLFGPFGVHIIGGEYGVTHVETGFRGHLSPNRMESKAVAEALAEIPGWEQVKLNDSLEVIGFTEEMATVCRAARDRTVGRFKDESQPQLTG